MATIVHLDTNVVIWLYSGYVQQLSVLAKNTIEANDLTVSPMVVLEVSYLYEIGRLKDPAPVIMNDLYDRIGLTVDTTSFPLVVDHAVQIQWTRDPFDRLITAQAAVYKNTLLTKDEDILRNYSKAVW